MPKEYITRKIRDTNEDRKRFKVSVAKSLERFEGKMALMAEWSQFGHDEKHLQKLKREVTKLRAQLVAKGVLLRDDVDF
jgi:hypothetical protein